MTDSSAARTDGEGSPLPAAARLAPVGAGVGGGLGALVGSTFTSATVRGALAAGGGALLGGLVVFAVASALD